MRLSNRVRGGGELLQDFEIAAEERFLEAQDLLARGHSTGATYLVGYVAEITLKSAVFRFDGARPADPVRPYLGPAKKWAQKAIPGLVFTNYHSVWFWARVLREKRKRRGLPLAEPITQNLMRIARRLEAAWAVELRYFGLEVDVDHARRTLEDVGWIKSHRTHLWK